MLQGEREETILELVVVTFVILRENYILLKLLMTILIVLVLRR